MSAASPPMEDLATTGGNPRRAVLMLASLPVLGTIVFALGLATGVRGPHVTMLALAILTAVVALVPVCLDQARPPLQRHLLLTITCIFYAALFVVPVFTRYLNVTGPIDAGSTSGTNLLPHHLIRGQWVALAGLVSLILGYVALPIGRQTTSDARRRGRDWPHSALLWVGAFMLAFGWSINAGTMLGVIPAAIGSGILGAFGSSMVYGNCLLTLATLRHRSRAALSLLVVAVSVSTALGFLTGSKRRAFTFVAAVALTNIFARGRVRTRWVVAGLVALVLLYPVSQFYRDVVLVDNTRTLVDVLKNPGPAFDALGRFLSQGFSDSYVEQGLEGAQNRLDGLGIESVIVRDTPSVSPFQYGRTLALFFVAFVPRAFWPDKPEITVGKWITATYGSGPHIDSFTAPTMVGDFYLNFGLGGVLAGMAIFGLALRIFHAWFLGPNATAAGIVAAVIITLQVITRLEGTFAQTMSSAIFALIPLMLTHLLVVRLSPVAPPAPRAFEKTSPPEISPGRRRQHQAFV